MFKALLSTFPEIISNNEIIEIILREKVGLFVLIWYDLIRNYKL